MSERPSRVAGGGARAAGVLLGLVGTAMFAFLVLGLAIDSRDSATQVLSAASNAAEVSAVDHWTPRAAVGGHQWRRTGRITATEHTTDCSDHPIEWAWANGAGLQLSLVRLVCSTPYAAYEVANNYAGTVEQVDFPASGEHYTWVYHDEHSAQVVWRQRGAMLALHLTCATATPACLTTAAALTKQVDGIGGTAEKADPKATDGSGYFLAPIAIWLVLVAPVRAVQLARRQRWDSHGAPPRYRDITGLLRQRQTRRIVRLVLWSAAVIAGLLFVLGIVDSLVVGGGSATGVTVSGTVCAAAFLGGVRIDPARRRKARTAVRNHGRRGRTGQLLCTWPSVLAATALVGYGVVVLAGGGARTVLLDRLYYSLSQARHGSSAGDLLRWMFVTVAIGYRDDVSSMIVLAVLPTLAFAYLLRAIGRRLQAADAAALLQVDNRPPFLYLRSFDEDALRISAPSLRTGPVERLIPWRRRSFERVVVDALSSHGPVVTVADPRVRLAPLGAARASLAHDEWQRAVAWWVQHSLAVVVGSTPSQVREGLAYELSMLAGSAWPRLLVVQAPYRRDDLSARWAGFRHHVAGLPLFAPLLGGWVQPGTHLLAYDSTRGWTAWGARWRTDRSYTAAIDEAVREEIDIWYREHQQAQRPADPAAH